MAQFKSSAMINNTFSLDGVLMDVEPDKLIINNGMRASFNFFIYNQFLVESILRLLYYC